MATSDHEEYPRRLSPQDQVSIQCLSGNMSVSHGSMRFGSRQTRSEVIPDGLNIGVMLSGNMEYRLNNQGPVTLAGPCLFILASRDTFSGNHVIPAKTDIRYANVQIDAGFAQQEFGIDFNRLAPGLWPKGRGAPLFLHQPATRPLQSLAAQILTCPLKGTVGDIYLAGKALEMVAVATSPYLERRHVESRRLSSAEVEKLHAARQVLMQELQSPPSLEGLAKRVGLNVKKLTGGFRVLFGTTVFAFLQEHRLEQAYQMLASGEITVSEAAYRVGYSAAHFSTVFQRRFGFPPRGLRG